MIGMMAVLKAVQLAIGGIKDMFNNVIELDKSLTELSKVTELTGNQLKAFTNKAYDAAETVGRTGQEVVDATANFKRAGYELKSSLELAKSALIMTNIGDGITDVTEASSALISVLRGFNISDADALKVVDRLNEVSNNSPVAFDNLTEGLKRVSGTMNQAGNSIDETIGMLTGGFAQLQNMEMVSSGLVFISQRLRGIGEDGEAIDGLAPKIAQEFKDIANIDIEDGNGGLCSTYDILQDMARIFPTLTEKQQMYLGNLAAGNRQIKVLNAILQQWQDVDNAVEQSNNSMGSATKENEVYRNSIAGIRKELESAVQDLSQTVIDSSFIKEPLKALTTFINLLTDLAGNDVLMSTLGIFLGTKVIKGASGLGSFVKDFNSVISSIVHGGDTISKTSTKANKGFGNLVKTVKDVPTAFRIAKQEGTGLKGVLDLLGISATTTQLALGAITAAITIGLAVWSSYQQAQEKARQVAIDSANTAREQSDNITELATKYIALSEAVGLDENSKAELLSIQEQLLQNFKLEGQTLDDLTAKYGSLTNAIKEKSIEALKVAQIDLTASIGANKDNLLNAGKDGFWGGNNIINATGNDAVLAFKALEKAGILNSGSFGFAGGAFVLTGDDSTVDGIIENYNRLGNALEVLQDRFTTSELEDNSIFNAINNRYKELQPFVNDYNSAIENLNSNLAQQEIIQSLQGQEIPKTKEAFDLWSKGVIDSAKSNKDFIGSIGDVENSVMSLISKIPEFKQFFHDIPDQNPLSLIQFNQKDLDEYNSQLDKIQSAYQSVSKAIEEARKQKYLSIDAYQALLTNTEGYLGYLINEKGQLDLSKEALKNLTKARIDDMAVQQAYKLLSAIEANKDNIDELNKLAGAHRENAKATWDNVYADLALLNLTPALNNAFTNQFKALQDAANSAKLGIDNYTSATMGATDATKQLEDAQKKFEAQLKAQGDAYIKAIDKKIDKLNEQKQAENDYFDKKIEELQAEKEAIRDTAEEEEKLLQIEKAKKAWEEAVSQKNTLLYKKGVGYYYGADQEAVDKAKEDYDNAQKEYNDYKINQSIDEKIKKYQQAKKAASDAIDAEIDKWTDLKDNISENMSLIGTSLEDHEMQMLLLVEAEKMSFEAMALAAEDYADRVISAMRRANSAKQSIASSGSSSGLKGNSNNTNSDKTHSPIIGTPSKEPNSNNSSYKPSQIYGRPTSSDDKFKKYASGTNFVPKSDLYNVDENGDELIIHQPKQGRLAYLEYGDKVINAIESTNILQALSQLGKTQTLSQMVNTSMITRPIIPSINNMPSGISMSFGDINLSGVQDESSLAKAIIAHLPQTIERLLYKK